MACNLDKTCTYLPGAQLENYLMIQFIDGIFQALYFGTTANSTSGMCRCKKTKIYSIYRAIFLFDRWTFQESRLSIKDILSNHNISTHILHHGKHLEKNLAKQCISFLLLTSNTPTWYGVSILGDYKWANCCLQGKLCDHRLWFWLSRNLIGILRTK